MRKDRPARRSGWHTIVVEASGSYSWLVDEMEWLGHCPKLCNPRPEVVLACEPIDLDIVLERLNLDPADQFYLIEYFRLLRCLRTGSRLGERGRHAEARRYASDE